MNKVVVDGRFESEPAKVVWKYSMPLINLDPQAIYVPAGAKLLHVEYCETSGPMTEFQLWYECPLETLGNRLPRVFQVWGTGHDTIPKSAKHVHTGIDWHEDRRNRRTSPQAVWHLYEFPSGAQIKEVE